MTAAAPTAQLGAVDLHDGDAGPAQMSVGPFVAVVGYDHTGLQGHDVVAVIPLLPFLLEGIAACGNDAQFFEV